jgi:hypothetical protein
MQKKRRWCGWIEDAAADMRDNMIEIWHVVARSKDGPVRHCYANTLETSITSIFVDWPIFKL